ncbi:hypothetical protein F5Y08DRAFT_335734 [Xylaria arbuscula]|nr:hypothetical protein F5Y08DRAFT_335734 [Xylaria arbuscula]
MNHHVLSFAAAASGHSTTFSQLGDNVSNENPTQALQTYVSYLQGEFKLLASHTLANGILVLPGLRAATREEALGRIAQIGRDAINIILANRRASLEKVYDELVKIDVVANSPEARDVVIYLLFAIVGRSTMLFTPCPLSSGTTSTLRISSEGYKCFEQDTIPRGKWKRPIEEIFHSLGMITPQSIRASSTNLNGRDLLDTRFLNAAVVCDFADISIQWSTCLLTHMSFDDSKRKLWLFALPSFCVLHDGPESSLLSVFYDTLKSSVEGNHMDHDNLSLDHYLREVLLSYHMLFAVDKKSRRYFRRRERRRCQEAIGFLDPTLERLCTETNPGLLDPEKINKSVFSATGDFVILYNRMAALQDFVRTHNPTQRTKLWNDRRDLNLAYTFRAVIIFGAIGVVLSLAQTALSAAQLFYSVK